MVLALRQAFREFVGDLPDMLRWWAILGVPLVLVFALPYSDWDVPEAIAGTGTVLAVGVSLLGFVWVHPLSGYTKASWARWWFAVLWWLVTLLPTLGAGLVLAAMIRRLLGSS
jgi:hypothetical protein